MHWFGQRGEHVRRRGSWAPPPNLVGVQEVWADDILLAFDGRVLEIFGFPGQESYRFHVRNMELSSEGPDRKQRHRVVVTSARGSGGCAFDVPPEDWLHVGPLLDEVLAAMPE